MQSASSVEVDLNAKCSFYTYDTAARILIAIIEFLLFHRNQLPFPYATFKFLVKKFTEDKQEPKNEEWNDYLVNKQRDLAETTLNSLNTISKVIYLNSIYHWLSLITLKHTFASQNLMQEFKTSDINEVLILFGSTIATPVEVYHIKLPRISRNHTPESHIPETTQAVKHILVALTISHELHSIATDLRHTNMFVLIHKRDDSSSNVNDLFRKSNFFIPNKCRKFILNIQNKTDDMSDETTPDCCRYMNVYNELNNLNIVVPKELSDTDERKANEKYAWFESNIVVKGFKDVLVKGKSIWE